MLFVNRTGKFLSSQVLKYTESTMQSLDISSSDDMARGFLYAWFCFSLFGYGPSAKSFFKAAKSIEQHISSLSNEDILGKMSAHILAAVFSSTIDKLCEMWDVPPKNADDFLTKHLDFAFSSLSAYPGNSHLEARKEESMTVLHNQFFSFTKAIK